VVFLSSFALADLQVAANQNIWAVPSTSKSCKAWKEERPEDDIQAKYINLGNLSFTWSDHEKDFRITEIRISLRDAVLKDGKYDCSVKGADLAALSDGEWLRIPKAKPNRYSYVATDCAMLCGGIEFSKDIAATMAGKIEVLGERLKDGKAEPAVYALPISVDNLEF
jgi:hypothetical protein